VFDEEAGPRDPAMWQREEVHEEDAVVSL